MSDSVSTRPPWWTRIPLVGNLGWPIALKEVRSLVRRNRYFWSQFLYLGILGVGVILIVALSRGEGAASQREIGASVFWGFFSLQTALLSVIYPAFAATSFSGERTERSFDLLITTDLTPAELVWGKFLGIFGNCTYLLLVTLPVLAVCILFGGVSLGSVFQNYLVLFLGGALLTMYGIWVSSGTASNVKAVILTYAPVLLFGSQFIYFLLRAKESLGGQAMGLIQVAAAADDWAGGALVFAAAFAGVALFGYFFLGAVVRLSSPESGAEAILRGYALSVVLGGLVLVGFVIDPAADPTLRVRWFQLIAGFGVLVVGLSVLGFTAADLSVPRKTVRWGRVAPIRARVSWLFAPGGVRGVAFVIVLAVILALGLSIVARDVLDLDSVRGSVVSGGARDGWVAARTIFGLLILATVAYGALGFLLSACGVTGGLNRLIVLATALLSTLVGLVWTVQSTTGMLGQEPVLGVSVLVTIMRYREAADSHAGLVASSFIVHVLLLAGALLAGIVVAKWRGIPLVRWVRRGEPGGRVA